ncbi:MAG: hypothetical protein ACRDM3_04280, partial [Rubrobacteraceae bacterium]
MRKVTPAASQKPPASSRPASSERSVGLDPEAVPEASSRLTSEANEGSLAHLLGQPVWVVASPGPGVFRKQSGLVQSDAELLDLLSVHLYRGSPLS